MEAKKKYFFLFLLVLMTGYYGYQYSQIKSVVIKNSDSFEFTLPILSLAYELGEREESEALISYLNVESKIIEDVGELSVSNFLSTSSTLLSDFTISKDSIEKALPALEFIRKRLDDIPTNNARAEKTKTSLKKIMDNVTQASESQVRIISSMEKGSNLSVAIHAAPFLSATSQLYMNLPNSDSGKDNVLWMIDFLKKHPYLAEYFVDTYELANSLNEVEKKSWFMGDLITSLMTGIALRLNTKKNISSGGATFGTGMYSLVIYGVIKNDTAIEKINKFFNDNKLGVINYEKVSIRTSCDFYKEESSLPKLKKGDLVLCISDNNSGNDTDLLGNDKDLCSKVYLIFSIQDDKNGYVSRRYVDLISKSDFFENYYKESLTKLKEVVEKSL